MITGTKPPHMFSEQHIYKIHNRGWARWGKRAALIASPLVTRASTSPARPAGGHGMVRSLCDQPHGQRALFSGAAWQWQAPLRELHSSPGQREKGTPWTGVSNHLQTGAKTWADGWGDGSPELCPSNRRWEACCAPHACTGCSLCCISAEPPALMGVLQGEGWRCLVTATPGGQCLRSRFKMKPFFWGLMWIRQSKSNTLKGSLFCIFFREF